MRIRWPASTLWGRTWIEVPAARAAAESASARAAARPSANRRPDGWSTDRRARRVACSRLIECKPYAQRPGESNPPGVVWRPSCGEPRPETDGHRRTEYLSEATGASPSDSSISPGINIAAAFEKCAGRPRRGSDTDRVATIAGDTRSGKLVAGDGQGPAELLPAVRAAPGRPREPADAGPLVVVRMLSMAHAVWLHHAAPELAAGAPATLSTRAQWLRRAVAGGLE